MVKIKSKSKFITLILLIVLGLIIYNVSYKNLKKTDLISEKIEENILKITEIASIKYTYKDILSYENNKIWAGIDLPFTSKKFIAKYTGYIKAGYEIDDLKIKAKDKETVEVLLGKPKILSNVINEEDVTFIDEKETVFNKLSYDDLYNVLIEEKNKNQKEAIENGIFNEAEKNLIDILEQVLKSMGFVNVVIKYV